MSEELPEIGTDAAVTGTVTGFYCEDKKFLDTKVKLKFQDEALVFSLDDLWFDDPQVLEESRDVTVALIDTEVNPLGYRDLKSVPRVGEYVAHEGREYEVQTVIWESDDSKADVQLRVE